MPEKEKCMFCQQIIVENLTRCPYCYTAAHQAELQRWILRFKTCPRCGRELKPFAK
ncbi:MAG: hypothetical protein LUQ65_13410 [Candidatus Helarchaeota archaeon]|nr:hypothetical protein [Candidatus Helarchaeota archaeon]